MRLFLQLLAFVTTSTLSTPLFLKANEALPTYFTYAAFAYCEALVTENVFPCGKDFTVPCDEVAGLSVNNKILNTAVNDTTTQAAYITISSKDEIIVSFRGTNDLALAKVDINLITEPFFLNNTVQVHRGFQQDYLGIREQILAPLQKIASQNPGFDIKFIGHSLGGALANIAAVDFLISTPQIEFTHDIKVVTFGQPRVGLEDWAKLFYSLPMSLHRVHNFGDPVPKVPLLFSNIGISIEVKDQVATICDQSGAPACLNDLKALNVNIHRNYFNVSTQCDPSLVSKRS